MLILLFEILAIMYISAALMVILSRNPVHSVLFLIIVFILNICFFFILGAEFLALIFLIIYVGAIAVLFLFIVMMLNIKAVELTEGFFQYLPVAYFIMYIFYMEIDYLTGNELFTNMSLKFASVCILDL
jgi:NADH-quinone oxidoreductase subunit J